MDPLIRAEVVIGENTKQILVRKECYLNDPSN